MFADAALDLDAGPAAVQSCPAGLFAGTVSIKHETRYCPACVESHTVRAAFLKQAAFRWHLWKAFELI